MMKTKLRIEGVLKRYCDSTEYHDGIKRFHDTLTESINGLFDSLMSGGETVVVILTPDGCNRLDVKSPRIDLTVSSHRGVYIDTLTGEVSFDISINGITGWRVLKPNDYIGVYLLVSDVAPDDPHNLVLLNSLLWNPMADYLEDTDRPRLVNDQNVIQVNFGKR